MPQFDVGPERVNAFEIDDQYLFKQYFERTDLFDELREYYNDEEYRFEVPAGEFEAVQEFLREEYIELVVVDDLEPYCVVKDQYTEHADILRNAVVHWQRAGYNFFLMKDELSVKEALERGATPVADTDLAIGL